MTAISGFCNDYYNLLELTKMHKYPMLTSAACTQNHTCWNLRRVHRLVQADVLNSGANRRFEFRVQIVTCRRPQQRLKLDSRQLAPRGSVCRFVEEGQMKTQYPIVIGGNNFGCGSSREHAPVAMGAAGARCVIAQSYARIFFRNCVAT